MRSITRFLLSMLWMLAALLLIPVNAAAKETEPAGALREVFVLDTSRGMQPSKAAVSQILAARIRKGFGDEMRAGDFFAIWTFNESVSTNQYLPIRWNPRSREAIATGVVRALDAQPYAGESRLDLAMTEVDKLIARSSALTVVVIGHGFTPITRTGFDDQINAVYAANAANETLLWTTLVVRGRQVVRWAVDRSNSPAGQAVKSSVIGAPTAKQLKSRDLDPNKGTMRRPVPTGAPKSAVAPAAKAPALETGSESAAQAPQPVTTIVEQHRSAVEQQQSASSPAPEPTASAVTSAAAESTATAPGELPLRTATPTNSASQTKSAGGIGSEVTVVRPVTLPREPLPSASFDVGLVERSSGPIPTLPSAKATTEAQTESPASPGQAAAAHASAPAVTPGPEPAVTATAAPAAAKAEPAPATRQEAAPTAKPPAVETTANAPAAAAATSTSTSSSGPKAAAAQIQQQHQEAAVELTGPTPGNLKYLGLGLLLLVAAGAGVYYATRRTPKPTHSSLISQSLDTGK